MVSGEAGAVVAGAGAMEAGSFGKPMELSGGIDAIVENGGGHDRE